MAVARVPAVSPRSVSPPARSVAVVGAGLGGMSAAALLAKAGFSVDLYERLPYAGGKAASRQLGAYRFDTGPSLFTMPWVFKDFFSALGERMEDRLKLIPLEPICNYFYPEGTRLSSYADERRFGAELERATGAVGAAAELSRYLKKGRRIWSVAGELFLKHSLHEASSYFSPSGLSSILRLPYIDPLRSLHEANAAAFSDPRAVQLFDRYATYNGSNPYKTPATMRIIPHVEYQWGGWAVEGGIVSVPRAIEAAARAAGVRFHLSSEVQAIRTDQGGARVAGIRVGAKDIDYDLVVSNADVLSTYRRLLGQPGAPEARRYEALEPSSSGLVFLWGVKRGFSRLSSNNIFFSSDYRREFSRIFDECLVPDDPTIYVNITSKTSPADAPGDGENWFVLINVPRNIGQDWPALAALAKTRILSRLSRELGQDIAPLIEAEQLITPADIERDTGSTYGSLYGIASNDRFAAFFRHANRSRRIRGLYFSGGSAHPGGGMPLALLSGSITAELARKYGTH